MLEAEHVLAYCLQACAKIQLGNASPREVLQSLLIWVQAGTNCRHQDLGLTRWGDVVPGVDAGGDMPPRSISVMNLKMLKACGISSKIQRAQPKSQMLLTDKVSCCLFDAWWRIGGTGRAVGDYFFPKVKDDNSFDFSSPISLRSHSIASQEVALHCKLPLANTTPSAFSSRAVRRGVGLQATRVVREVVQALNAQSGRAKDSRQNTSTYTPDHVVLEPGPSTVMQPP